MTINADLRREREKCSFDPMELTHFWDGDPEKTSQRRERGVSSLLIKIHAEIHALYVFAHFVAFPRLFNSYGDRPSIEIGDYPSNYTRKERLNSIRASTALCASSYQFPFIIYLSLYLSFARTVARCFIKCSGR